MSYLDEAEKLVRGHPANKELMELEDYGFEDLDGVLEEIHRQCDYVFYTQAFDTVCAVREQVDQKPAHLESYLKVIKEHTSDMYVGADGVMTVRVHDNHELARKTIKFNLDTGKPLDEESAEIVVALLETT